MLEEFRYVLRFRVGFFEIDRLQHVNNVHYLRWLETARIEYIADVLERPLDNESREGFIQANVAFAYEQMVGYRDAIAVGARVSRIGTKSLTFRYSVVNETSGVRAGAGETALVCFDYVAGKSIAIPSDMRARIIAYENVPPEGV